MLCQTQLPAFFTSFVIVLLVECEKSRASPINSSSFKRKKCKIFFATCEFFFNVSTFSEEHPGVLLKLGTQDQSQIQDLPKNLSPMIGEM